MIHLLGDAWSAFVALVGEVRVDGAMSLALKFIPFVVFLELPVHVFILAGILRYWLRTRARATVRRPYFPVVSCIITCYSEGRDVQKTLRSLAEQLYPGHIQMIPVIDGALQNRETHRAAEAFGPELKGVPNRTLTVLPKLQRGGRVSSLNAGLRLAKGPIVMALDGDTSFDNDMVANAVRHFADANVVGVAGNLRVRNARKSLATRLQAIEYMLSIHASKVGLSEFNVVNNISGAFGVFRKEFIERIGGWDSGTAEDLDITLRMKKYFGRHPGLRIVFEPYAIGHTDAPETFRGFFKQRLRWDGDLYYLYIRKYRYALSPGLLGWRNFLILVWTGLLFQQVLPFAIIAYSAWVLLAYSLPFFLALQAFVYCFYLALTLSLFIPYVALLSERPRQDLALSPYVALFPLLAFATRIWCGVSTLNEMITRQHLDSSMAPWWVLRKTKF
jgi:cellulose synthase/poly-beta-1,6-N-acetylglucosamine synthase-like glycosyltransferase